MRKVKMYCTYCGAAYKLHKKDTAVFCRYCGNKLVADTGEIDGNIKYIDIDEAEKKEKEQFRGETWKAINDLENRNFEEKYGRWKKRFLTWLKIVLLGGALYGSFFLAGALESTDLVKGIIQNEDLVALIMFLTGPPILIAFYLFLFGAPYFFLTGLKWIYVIYRRKRLKHIADLKR